MKVSLNWLKEYTNIEIGVDELVERIGSQLGAVEQVVNYGERYQGIVIAKIVSCGKHPDADKLSLCYIDDGGKVQDVPREGNGQVQVVCGAPNVREGMMVAWLPPGSVVPNSFNKDPFILTSREIRGKTSHGMLASASELGISDDHNGIVEIELDAKPGDDFAEAYKLNDYIIDIENKMFTHRPDCFGILGVAREVAGIQGIAFSSPDWYKAAPADNLQPTASLELEVMNIIPEAVPSLTATGISEITVNSSPLLMQTMLSRVGIRPINNIVDITNYMMVLTGQPLHAFDYDKVKALSPDGEPARLVARWSHDNENLNLLNGKTLKLEDQAMVISSGTVAMALAGIMGGADTEVDNNTSNVILECANFDMYAVRRATMRYGIFSDAATRFNKGQSPFQTLPVLRFAVSSALPVTGGKLATKLFNEGAELAPMPAVKVSAGFINQRLGLELDAEAVKNLLTNVEFGVEISGDEAIVTPPFWRTDIAIKEDIVEEVGRLYGYDKLPLHLPKRDLTPAAQEPMLLFKARLRQVLSAAGSNECLTYSFVNGKLVNSSGQKTDDSYHIRNALSPDLQYYRQSLAPSLLEKAHPNIKAGEQQFVLYELGVAHHKSAVDEAGLPNELPRLAAVVAASEKQAKNLKGAPFFAAKDFAELLAKQFSIDLSYKPMRDCLEQLNPVWQAAAASYNQDRAAVIYCGSEVAGIAGELNQLIRTPLKLPAFCAALELDAAVLLANQSCVSRYQSLGRFPSSTQDITLAVSAELSYEQLEQVMLNQLAESSTEHGYRCQLTAINIFKPAIDSPTKNVTFQLSVEHPARTLTTDEVNEMITALASFANEKLGARQV